MTYSNTMGTAVSVVDTALLEALDKGSLDSRLGSRSRSCRGGLGIDAANEGDGAKNNGEELHGDDWLDGNIGVRVWVIAM